MKISTSFAVVAVLFAAQLMIYPVVYPADAGQSAKATAVAPREVPEVELYITSWCPYCKKAVEFFRTRGIPFVAYDIEKDQKAAFRKTLLDKGKGVPFAIIYGRPVHGYSEDAYLKALEGRRK